MNIINSLSQIAKNSSNFQKWEAEHDSIDSKREELNKKHPPTAEELKKAKDLGKTIIDVVSIMDQHSEDIAQNVEMATALPMTLIPTTSLIISGFTSYKAMIKPALSKYQKELSTFFNKNNNEKTINEFHKQIQKLNPHVKIRLAKPRYILNKEMLHGVNIPDKIKLELEPLQEEFLKIQKPFARKMRIGIMTPFLAFIASFVAGNIYATKLQVGSSKVARFQAREVLKDPKYFVKYTPEQEDQAQQNLKTENKTDIRTNRLKSGIFSGIKNILKDSKAYEHWRNSEEAKPERIDRPLSDKELKQAQKDKEIIQRTIRKINNNAEIYSQNMEVLSTVIIGGTPLLGWIVGLGVSKVLTITKITQKITQKLVNKYGNKEAQQAYNVLKEAPTDAENKLLLYLDFAKKMNTSNIEKDSAKNITASNFSKFLQLAKQNLAVILSTKYGSNALMGKIGGFTSLTIGLFLGLKLQKDSARAGRFVTKKELEDNPQNFVGYTPEEIQSVEAPCHKKKNKFKEQLLFLPKVAKQYLEYRKFVKTELKQNRLLKEHLTKLEVSEEQLNDAKNLQRKLFNTFEQVDDKSQDYSESVEVVAQVTKPFLFYGAMTMASLPLLIFAHKAATGKISYNSVGKKILSLLANSTNLMQKKFFKNYLNDVAKNIPNLVKNTGEISSTPKINKMSPEALSEFDSKKLIISQAIKGLKLIVKHADKTKAGTNKILNILDKTLEKLMIPKVDKTLSIIVNQAKKSWMLNSSVHLMGKIADKMATSKHQKIAKTGQIAKILRILKEIDITSIDKAKARTLIANTQKIIKNLPEEELKNILSKIIDEYEKNPDEFITMISNKDLNELFIKALITPKLKLALKAAGYSWGAFTIGMLYIIESWVADKELKAGRLGVMKALESLDDPAYYADTTIENSNK